MPATLDPSTGLVAQTAAEVLDELGTAVQTSTGRADLDVSTGSPLGRLLWPVAERTADLQTLMASALWALDPETAGGPLLSVVALLRGTSRLPASASTLTLRAIGTPGTDVSGRSVRSAEGDVWYLADGSVIGLAGFVDATATAADLGPISATEAGPWTILESVAGWSSVTGQTGTLSLGEDEETDPDLRARLAASLSQARGTEPAIYAAIAQVPGVDASYLSAWVNRTDTTDAAGLPPHSVELIAEGGTDAAVAEALLRVVPLSAGYYQGPGSTEVTIALAEDGRNRTVWITRPEAARIYAEVTLDTSGATLPLPTGIEATVRAALVAWAETCRPRQTLTAASAEAYLSAYVPAGAVSAITVDLSTNGTSYTSYAFPGYRAYGRISDEPSTAVVLGTIGEPFAISAGWQLDLRINGGLVVSFAMSGTETSAADVAAALGALSGATASDEEGALRIETALAGGTASIEIRNTSTPALLAVLGLSVGTTYGRASDIAYYVV